MLRGIVIALSLSLFLVDVGVVDAQARQTRLASEQRQQLSLIVVGGKGELARRDLAQSLERSLDVKVTSEGTRAELGVLSVMVSQGRATLLWTLPDGRSGVARLRGDLRGEGLREHVVSAASSMYRGFVGHAGGVVMAAR